MPRLIDADALMEKKFTTREFDGTARGWTLQVVSVHDIENAPTIDPESLRPRGHWIGEGDGYADGEIVLDVWYCSECDYCIDDGTDDPDMLPEFCPNCWAKMEEESKCE